MPSGHPGQVPATCHPDRPHLARGLCAGCYRTITRRERVARMTPAERATYEERRRVYFTAYRQKYRSNPELHEKERIYQREYQRRKAAALTPEQRWGRHLWKYGLTVADYKAMAAAQGGRCAACGTPDDHLEVDHCHTRGFHHIRGLICRNCNSALGHAKDDVERLRALITYLLAVGLDAGNRTA